MSKYNVEVIDVGEIGKGLTHSQIMTLSIETMISVPIGVVFKKDLLHKYDFDLNISLRDNPIDQMSFMHEIKEDPSGEIANESFYKSAFEYIAQPNVFGFDTYQDDDPFFKSGKRRVTYFLDMGEIDYIHVDEGGPIGVSSDVYFKNGQSVTIDCNMLKAVSEYEKKLISQDINVDLLKAVKKVIKV